MQLHDVRAVVTGGARGMGRHFAHRLTELGGQAVFCDLDPAAVAATSDAIGVPGIVADVSDEAAVDHLFDAATERLGAVPNVLVNNAGILRDGLLVKKDRETGEVSVLSKSAWDAVLAVNLTGAFLCMRAFAKRVVEHGEGPAVAVQMSSISRSGNRGQSNYSAAKAALAADTAVWAKELARYGVRVGAIAPGFIETPMVAGMRPEVLQKVIAPVPLRRLGQPEEVFCALKFIVECDYFTGRVVEVDGGLVL